MTASSESSKTATKEPEATHNPGVNEVHTAPETEDTVMDQETVVDESRGGIDEIHFGSNMDGAVIENHTFILDTSVGGPRIVTAFENARNLVINGGTVVLGGSSGVIMQTAATVTTQRARTSTGYHAHTHASRNRTPASGAMPPHTAGRGPGQNALGRATSGWNAVHRDAFFSHIIVDSDAIDTGAESDPPPPYVTPPPYAT